MARIKRLHDYKISENDQFLIDANVWIYVFYPMGDFDKYYQDKYSRFLADCKKSDVKPKICNIVVSEIVNKCIRFEYEYWKGARTTDSKDFKKNFRTSEAYKEAIDLVSDIINQIMRVSQPINDKFDSFQMDDILARCYDCDFTDSYLIHHAKEDGYIIVTEDKDIKKHTEDINVLSS